MLKRYIILSSILFFVLISIDSFSRISGIGADDFQDNNLKLILQDYLDNNTGNIAESACEEGWLERIEVSDTTPKAGQTITIEGFCWDPYKYADGIEIILRNSSGSSANLTKGKVVPDEDGNFKIKVKLSKTYKYGDIIEILCGDETNPRELLKIED
jgi:hypothetical protein